MKEHIHHADCGCLAMFRRRRLLGLGLGAAAAVAAAGPAAALDKGYEAMLLKCIDPRFTTNTWAYMASRGWQNLYSQFNIGGGPIGVVAPVFADWHKAFWDNLDISVKLHEVKRVIAITHRDCGAAAVAYGDRIKTDKAFETEMHTKALHEFRSELRKRQPHLVPELGIMDLNGAVEVVA
ncbi:hypothetical protein [Enhydrobacter sp.]|jgi:hypothetical protein|uniref:hypothetical protein n=1 Tax=Enhydrobacter sp. TaxID=1894999 RepID=UPI00261C5C95|nr:hypothetical protein [Enhydrobacter sp.]WIM12424.1 MAG: hypothetical protein OJF58_003386 [Enhydrobacter sp.]